MKISVKGQYGLIAMTYLGLNEPNVISSSIISEKLNLSKIYLEQVLSLLKRAKLVHSEKGSNGGYTLAKATALITTYDILYAIETKLFERFTLSSKSNHIEATLDELVYKKIDNDMITNLKSIRLDDLVNKAKENSIQAHMYYI
jgi:Rrf2 family protein